MAEVVVNLASSMTDGVYTSAGVAVEEDYATLMLKWANLNDYPELVVEQSLDDTNYYPLFQSKSNYEEPVKYRFNDTSGVYSINIHPVLATTPYVRVKVYANGATVGTITYDLSVGA